MTATTLKWGIMGSADIAKRALIPGIKASRLNEVAAIASRGIEKAEQTAREFDIPKYYGSYEQLLNDPDIDAVYIPLPNHLHKEWTIRAAEAGKHILCEKPLALNAAEAQEMADACEKAGVVLAEAFMYRYHPRYDLIRSIIDSGEIGDVRAIRSSFTFNGAGAKENVRFRKEWGGGSIYDVGCYPISAARLLLGAEPEAVTVQALFSPQHGDVDMMASGLIEFPNAVPLTFECGMWATFRNPLDVLGTKGIIEVPWAFVTPEAGSGAFYVQSEEGRRRVEVSDVDAYTAEADALYRAAKGEQPLRFSAADAVGNMRVVEACLRSARERRRIEL